MTTRVTWVGIRPVDKKEGHTVLGLAALFLVIALLAGLAGFSGFAGDLASIAWILFIIFIALFVISAAANMLRGRGSTAT
jgi:uncharacterized membrane protein YtjA (UPF0391 family)